MPRRTIDGRLTDDSVGQASTGSAAPVTSWIAELGLGRPVEWPAMAVRTDATTWPRPADAGLLELRRSLLASHPECVGALPGSEQAAAEASRLVGEGDLSAAAVAQGDDLCVLAPEQGWPLVAGVVLFPSHWKLADKLGLPLAAVHDRVPGYPVEQVDRFLDRLPPGRAVWRRNLLVHRDGALHAPEPSPVDVPVAEWWLRSERQTLRRLPVTAAVLFTIHTDTEPLASLSPSTRSALADRLASFPARWAGYAGVAAELPELVSWLRR
jgi:dimethylamine monooxygenase subunit A